MSETKELSLDELRQFALDALTKPEAVATEETQEEQQEQPRDDKGRFKKPEEKEEEQQVEDVDEIVYERTIDLGDGGGVQVFRAKSIEELVDKLANAQEHATRKIREQAAQLRTKAEQAIEEAEMTPEEKFVLSQKMLTDPTSVIEQFVEKKFNKLTKAQEDARRQAEQKEQQSATAAEDFVRETPEYYVTEKNGRKMVKWLETHGLEGSIENIRAAYQDLSESGLLEVKPEEKNASEEEQAGARIERKAEATVVRRKVVGGSVSTKRSAPAPEPTTSGPTETDFSKMTTDQLREAAMKQVLGL